MDKGEQYLRRAKECRERADKIKDPTERTGWLQIAASLRCAANRYSRSKHEWAMAPDSHVLRFLVP